MATVYDPGRNFYLPVRISYENYFRLAQRSPEEQRDVHHVQQDLQVTTDDAEQFLYTLRGLRRYYELARVRAELLFGNPLHVSLHEIAEHNGGLTSIYTMKDLGLISKNAQRVLHSLLPTNPLCLSAQPESWWLYINYNDLPLGYRPQAATQLELRQLLMAWDIRAGVAMPLPERLKLSRSIPLMQQSLREEFTATQMEAMLSKRSIPQSSLITAWDHLQNAGFDALNIQAVLGRKPVMRRAGRRPQHSQLPQAPGA